MVSVEDAESNTTGKAGGLNVERLKGAHETVSRPWQLPYFQLHLVVALVLIFLVTDVRSNNALVQSNRRNKIASRPKMLTGKVLLSPAKPARNLNRALPLQVPDHVRHRVLRRNADAYMNVIAHQMTFDNLRFLV